MTFAEALREGAARLAAAGIGDAPREARILLGEASGLEAAALQARIGEALEPAQADRFRALLAARGARLPMAQVIGRRMFWGRDFAVTPDVLDPRPETESLIAAALDAHFARVADLGTGSGAILVTLLAERPEASGLGTDISPAALAVAQRNAAALGVAERAQWAEGAWFDAVAGRYDLIVSNPPYIAEDEMAGLAPELHHEPRIALTDGGDGLSAYRAICAGARAHLAPGGRLMVEIGHAQGAAVAALFRAAGLENVAVQPDMDGRDRVVLGHTPR